jgi:hypothetical protein
MTIEGEHTPRFRLVRTTFEGENVPGDPLVVSDTKSEISAWLTAHQRADWSYRVWDGRKKLTLTEFATLSWSARMCRIANPDA